MKKTGRFTPFAIAAKGTMSLAGFLLLLSTGASPLAAQNKNATANSSPAGIPRTADGKPDFTGFYEWPKSDAEQCRCSATIFDRKNFAGLKPGGEPFLEARTGDPRHDEPRDFCMPAGFPSGMLSAYAMQFFQNKDNLVMVHEFQRMTRVIPLDGRKHREDMEPTFYGDPVGHWEGDTLVIETTGFKRWGLDDYFYKDEKEYRMHSDALKTIERIKYQDPKTLSYNLTIDDPKTFVGPWSQEFKIRARPEWEKNGMVEYVCEENNRCPGGHCGGGK